MRFCPVALHQSQIEIPLDWSHGSTAVLSIPIHCFGCLTVVDDDWDWDVRIATSEQMIYYSLVSLWAGAKIWEIGRAAPGPQTP